jgi:hypothetical protein
MRLYRLESNATTKAIFDFASRVFPWKGSLIYIDGKNEQGCGMLNNDNGTYSQVFRNCTTVINNAICEFINTEREA